MNDTESAPKTKKKRTVSRIILSAAYRTLKVILWTAMGIVLAVAAALICTVRVLTPENLTPIVSNVANRMLDADVSLGRIELSFSPRFPHLQLNVDSLTVVSKAFDTLPADERAQLPAYADTLLRIGAFEGGIDILSFVRHNRVELHNLSITRPEVNIIMSPSGKGNFEIYRSEPADTTAAPVGIPAFSIDRFALLDPQAIRYFNARDSIDATVVLLAEMNIAAEDTVPMYRLRIGGNLGGGMSRSMLNVDDIAFDADGHIGWTPENPSVVSVDNMTLRGGCLNATVDTEISISDELVVRTASFDIKPVAADSLLVFLPSDLRREYGLDSRNFSTDATVAVKGSLTAPYNTSAEALPYADIHISIPQSSLRYGKARFDRLSLDMSAYLRGDSLDNASVELRRLFVAGPATNLTVSGTAANLISDPQFDATVKGHTDISKLPPVIANLARGYISGKIDADLSLAGRSSMFMPGRFNNLAINGRLTGSDLYYLSNDTATMAEATRIGLSFDTQKRFKSKDKRTSSPMLTAKIEVDSATVLAGGVDIVLARFSLGAASQNVPLEHDSTVVVPMGGQLKIGRLAVRDLVDSTGVRISDLEGGVLLHRCDGDAHRPELLFSLNSRRIRIGSPLTRFILRNPEIKFATHKLPKREMPRRVRALADSLAAVHPDLTADSVLMLAYEKHREQRAMRRHRRIHAQLDSADTEIIDWGTSRGLKKFLRNWALSGTIKTDRARLATPYFPLRNSMKNLDVSFCNDSIVLYGTTCRFGKSQFTAAGVISNMRRSLTSSSGRQALKLNFDLDADTIDINEIAAATFAGSAFAEREKAGLTGYSDSDDDFDRQVDALMSEQPDSVGPLLVPTNIDAEVDIKASTVLYSDLIMSGLSGQALLYDGALTFNRLSAMSEAGRIGLTALYSAPKPTDMKFGFGLFAKDFHIDRFIRLVPAIDSVMPLLHDISGIIDANIAATVDIDRDMNFILPSLNAAVNLSGDSLRIIDPDTYRTLGKWLRFKNRNDNLIREMNVEMLIKDNVLQVYPFVFNIDRYRLGVQGYNDLDMNFNYHIAVLKSPLPFKFGINIKGNLDDYKVRFGGAKFKEAMVAERHNLVDTARVNLISQIRNVFRRGVRNSGFAKVQMTPPPPSPDLAADMRDSTLSHADSVALIREGLIEGPLPDSIPADTSKKKGRKTTSEKNKKKKRGDSAADTGNAAIRNKDD